MRKHLIEHRFWLLASLSSHHVTIYSMSRLYMQANSLATGSYLGTLLVEGSALGRLET